MEREPGGFRRIERREFLKFSGAVYLVTAPGCAPERPREPPAPPTEAIDASKLPFPPSAAYLLLDTRKCQGCLSCMLVCPLAHEGRENLSLARLERRLEAVVGDAELARAVGHVGRTQGSEEEKTCRLRELMALRWVQCKKTV